MSNRAERSRHFWATALNLPNQLTFLRLLLAVAMFCLIAWEQYLGAFVLFLIASGTDWLDGYFARKYGQVTTLGRILDPFADKVIICGAFIYMVALPEMQDVPGGRSAGSLAWAGLANTYFWIDRTRNVTGVFLSQVLPFFDETAVGLFGKLETEVNRGL